MNEEATANVFRLAITCILFLMLLSLTFCSSNETTLNVPPIEVPELTVVVPPETIAATTGRPLFDIPWSIVSLAIVAITIIVSVFALKDAANALANGASELVASIFSGLGRMLTPITEAAPSAQLLSLLGIAAAGLTTVSTELGDQKYLVAGLLAVLSIAPLIMRLTPENFGCACCASPDYFTSSPE